MYFDRRLLQLARNGRLTLFLTISLGVVAGVLVVLQANILSRIVSRVFLSQEDMAGVSRLMTGLLGVILLRGLLAWGSEVTANALARRVKADLRQQLLRRFLALGPLSMRGEHSGELTSAALEGVEMLDAYYSQYLPGLALAALVPLTYLAFVAPLDPLSAVVMLVTAPLIPLFMILIGNAAQALTRRQWAMLSRMSAYFLDVLQGLTTLKLLGRSRSQTATIAEVGDRFRRATMSVLRVTFLSALVLEMVATLSTAVVAVEIGLRLLYGRMTFEQAFFILLLAPEFYLPMRQLGARFHAGMSGVAAAKRIFAILGKQGAENANGRRQANDTQQAARGGPRTTSGERNIAQDGQQLPPAVRFDEVRFAYPPDATLASGSSPAGQGEMRPALRGVSFEIGAGQKIALVGPSGGGKSTIAALLLTFIRPDRGQIWIDGRPLESIAPAEWLARVAWVPQNPYLFNDSVAANIRLAKPEATLEQVVWAARQAEAHEFIEALPQGYDTLIGERGSRLSGGQAQRIVLARAFLKDASLIIMDEATANLDPENEARVQAALARLVGGRTVFVIAHRLNTILGMDQILVVDQGQVVEQGSHASLLQQGGVYRRFMQAFVRQQSMIEPAAGKPDEAQPIQAGPVAALPAAFVPIYPDSATYSPAAPGTSGRDVSRMHTLARLLSFLMPYAGWVALSMLMGAATVLSGVGLMAASAYIISAAALHPSVAELQVAIVGVRAFGISRGLFRYLERYLSHQTTFRLLARLRIWFYQALEPLAPARLAAYRSGDLLARILGDIESLENFYVRVISPWGTALLVAGALLFFLASFDPMIGWTWIGLYLAAGLLVPLAARMLSRPVGEQAVVQRAALSAALVDGLQGMADLLSCNQGQGWVDRTVLIDRKLGRAQSQMAHLSGLQAALTGILANLGLWMTLALAIPLVRSGRMEGVYLAVAILAALTGFEAIGPLPLAAQYLESNLQAARRLFEVVDVAPAACDPAEPARLGDDFHLQIRRLRFRYPDLAFSDQPAAFSEPKRSDLDHKAPGKIPVRAVDRLAPGWALDGIDLDLPVGKHVAIVGPSGAGKSTLVSLLARFWDGYEGEILLGGRELRQVAQEDLRRNLAVVSQNTYLFSASLRDNLRIARPQASQEEIVRAAQQAQIHEWIETLPHGYDTWIGEQGLQLSGGERQRLAIGRALLRDAPLLILDEATASLDVLTEGEVLHAIQDSMKGRTMLMITHRLVGMEAMDEILVLDQGRVVERGRHAELLRAGRLYRRMWDLQRLGKNYCLFDN